MDMKKRSKKKLLFDVLSGIDAAAKGGATKGKAAPVDPKVREDCHVGNQFVWVFVAKLAPRWLICRHRWQRR